MRTRVNRLLNGWGWAVGLTVLAAAPHLAEYFWYDEAFTRWLAMASWGDMLKATTGDVHPPLWYALMWLWGRVAGYSEIALRLPSLLLGMGSIPLAYTVLGRLNLPRPAIMWGLAGMALAPFSIQYHAEARGYSLLQVALLVAVWGWQTRRPAVLYLSLAVAMYTHNMAILWSPLGLAGLWRFGRRGWFWAVVAGAIYAPWVPMAIYQVQAVQTGYWPTQNWGMGKVYLILCTLINGNATGNLHWLAWHLGIAHGGLMLAGGVAAVRNRNPGILLAVVGPVILAAGYSLLGSSVLIPRVMFPSAPYLYTLMGWGGWQMWQKRAGRVALLAILPAYVGLLGMSLEPMRDNLGLYTELGIKAGDACYHSNAGSLVTLAPYLPCEHYLLPIDTKISENLSTETKQAMQINLLPVGAVPEDKIYFFSVVTPFSPPSELAGNDEILTAYQHATLYDGGEPLTRIRIFRLYDKPF